MKIRQMFKEDLDFALALTNAEGWSSTRGDFEELLKYDSHGCFIGEVNKEPIGMVCAVAYQRFGFIGNLIVDESHRQQQFGKTLMEYAMHYLRDLGAESILLDGVPKAVTLYEKLGFREICRSLRLEGRMAGQRSTEVRPMGEDDFRQVGELDTRLFGGRRDSFLAMRFAAHPEYCKVLEINGKIHGYIIGSDTANSVRIGPWVTEESDAVAEQLLLDFAQDVATQSMKVGVLANNTRSLDLLIKHGFKDVSFSLRMVCGKDTKATLSTNLYAICSPDRG